LVHEFVRE
jgi:hypothetical protein